MIYVVFNLPTLHVYTTIMMFIMGVPVSMTVTMVSMATMAMVTVTVWTATMWVRMSERKYTNQIYHKSSNRNNLKKRFYIF